MQLVDCIISVLSVGPLCIRIYFVIVILVCAYIIQNLLCMHLQRALFCLFCKHSMIAFIVVIIFTLL